MKKYIPYLIIVGIILAAILTVQFLFKRINNLKQEVQNQTNKTKALTDTIKTYKDKNGNLVSEKRSLQINLDEIKDENIELSQSKADLIEHVEELEKRNKVINSALIQTSTVLDSLKNEVAHVDTTNKRLQFNDSTQYYNYKLTVGNALPYKDKKPYLNFDQFRIYTDYNVDFVWGEKKEGYPVKVKVTSSNKYVQTTGIESYTVPEIKPDKSGWQKTWDWIKGKSDMLVGFGIGYGVGQLNQ